MILLFTDFGNDGPYTGQVKAVLSMLTTTKVIDLFSDLPVCNIKAAAYLLPAYIQHTDKNAICLGIVDPGVGGNRNAIILQADGRWFVGPDNGLFSIVMWRAHTRQVWNIAVPKNLVGSSFHGRDLFAPVAAAIANGEEVLGNEITPGLLIKPNWPDELAEIIYIDRYGNAITGIRATSLDAKASITIHGQVIHYAKVFSKVRQGECLWYENANGLVELSANCASISSLLGLQVGDRITTDQDT